jgi:hypothetical protein
MRRAPSTVVVAAIPQASGPEFAAVTPQAQARDVPITIR